MISIWNALSIAHKLEVLLILVKMEGVRRNALALIIGVILIPICVLVLVKITVEISIFKITLHLETYAFEFAHILIFMAMPLPIHYNLIVTKFVLTTITVTIFPLVTALRNVAKT